MPIRVRLQAGPAGHGRSLLVTIHFEGAREFATVHARAVNLLDGYVNA